MPQLPPPGLFPGALHLSHQGLCPCEHFDSYVEYTAHPSGVTEQQSKILGIPESVPQNLHNRFKLLLTVNIII